MFFSGVLQTINFNHMIFCYENIILHYTTKCTIKTHYFKVFLIASFFSSQAWAFCLLSCNLEQFRILNNFIVNHFLSSFNILNGMRGMTDIICI